MKTAFKIPIYNYPVFLKKIEASNKKAGKLMTTPIVVNEIDTERVPVEDPHGENYTVEYKVVEVAGDAPKLNGRMFVVCLDHGKDSKWKDCEY